jgi:hypothetical protein
MRSPMLKFDVHKPLLLLANGFICSRLDERIICNALVIPFCIILASSVSYIISIHTILHHTCGALDTHRAS